MELKRLYAEEDAIIAQLLDSYAAGVIPRVALKDRLTVIQNKIKTLLWQ